MSARGVSLFLFKIFFMKYAKFLIVLFIVVLVVSPQSVYSEDGPPVAEPDIDPGDEPPVAEPPVPAAPLAISGYLFVGAVFYASRKLILKEKNDSYDKI